VSLSNPNPLKIKFYLNFIILMFFFATVNFSDDKDGLISNDEGPVIGKGGHVIESRGSVDLQKDGSNRESSPLHSNKKGPVSGKDL
jgi:hypothetical protein